jgi:ABC-type uncharacterized transport system involved in gliding motility auxiliary subunit
MNPLHEGIDLDTIGSDRDRIVSVDLQSTKDPSPSDSHPDQIKSNGYSTVATTAGEHGHGHDLKPLAPSRLPESVQNALEYVFKLKKRGTTFEVSHYT